MVTEGRPPQHWAGAIPDAYPMPLAKEQNDGAESSLRRARFGNALRQREPMLDRHERERLVRMPRVGPPFAAARRKSFIRAIGHGSL
jgi:hypothetical protein